MRKHVNTKVLEGILGPVPIHPAYNSTRTWPRSKFASKNHGNLATIAEVAYLLIISVELAMIHVSRRKMLIRSLFWHLATT